MEDTPKIFTTVDPMNRKIALKDDTWGKHIVEKHDECSIEDIKTNIQNPDYIFQNVKPINDGSSELIIDDTRQDYIGFVIKDDRLFAMKTIVQLVNGNEGFVVTNHILRRVNEIKTTGGVIYDRNKSKSTTEIIDL